MGRMSKRKGATGEREVAALLREYGVDARRGRQFCGGPTSPDVIADMPFHFEVKRTESLSLYPAMEQAQNDCPAEKIPVVIHRRSKKGWLVVLTVEDFMRLTGREKKRVRRVSR